MTTTAHQVEDYGKLIHIDDTYTRAPPQTEASKETTKGNEGTLQYTPSSHAYGNEAKSLTSPISHTPYSAIVISAHLVSYKDKFTNTN